MIFLCKVKQRRTRSETGKHSYRKRHRNRVFKRVKKNQNQRLKKAEKTNEAVESWSRFDVFLEFVPDVW